MSTPARENSVSAETLQIKPVGLSWEGRCEASPDESPQEFDMAPFYNLHLGSASLPQESKNKYRQSKSSLEGMKAIFTGSLPVSHTVQSRGSCRISAGQHCPTAPRVGTPHCPSPPSHPTHHCTREHWATPAMTSLADLITVLITSSPTRDYAAFQMAPAAPK